MLKKTNYRWLWADISQNTKKVVAFYIGDRSENSCKLLWASLPSCLKNSKTFSDFWKPYDTIITSGSYESVGKESSKTNHMER